ncbi:MAG: alpha/beta hydrolase [Planctomycetota bacterium]|nr:alpha/beta hydrolase [Planctomycetota bacterium]
MRSREFSRGFLRLVVASVSAVAGTASGQTTYTYATLGGRALQLDLYRATSVPPNERTPCVVYIHGGGWQSGTRSGVPPYVVQLTASGVSVASASYRLTSQAGRWGSEPVTFPAQIHDVKGAIRWLRANAGALALDPLRFATWGPSAGGHLSALVGTSGDVAEIEGSVGGNTSVSSRVQAFVDYFGPTDLLQMNPDVTTPPGSSVNHDAPNSPESRLIGFDDPDQGVGVLRANITNPAPPFPFYARLAEQANPLTWVDGTDPETFIAHGTADTVVPLRQSERLEAAMQAAGVTARFVSVANAGHGGFPEIVHTQATTFLIERLRCRADVNRNGEVDFFDYLDFVALLNAGNWQADFDHSGVVDFFDYLDFAAEVSNGCSP